MSCPDWKTLTAAREARREDPPGWRAGLEHLAGCEACRRQALAADPTLLFQRLPRLEAGADEVAAMRSAVATLVRSRRVGAPVAAVPSRSRLSLQGWLRPAAAAALLAGVLTLGPAGPTPERPAPAAASGTGAATVRELAAAPALVEDLDLPQARVYQLAREDLSVVMIVDSSFDL